VISPLVHSTSRKANLVGVGTHWDVGQSARKTVDLIV
jgi:hypothetical protein